MYKNGCGIMILVIALGLGVMDVYGNEDVVIRNKLQAFFSVLRSGNTAAIEAHLGGNLHRQRRTLLRENREYAKFLRQYYQGTEFQIEKITQGKSETTANVKLIFPDGKSEQLTLFLAREAGRGAVQGRGAWKIVEYTDQAEIQARDRAQ
jgi:hypothetical protein